MLPYRGLLKYELQVLSALPTRKFRVGIAEAFFVHSCCNFAYCGNAAHTLICLDAPRFRTRTAVTAFKSAFGRQCRVSAHCRKSEAVVCLVHCVLHQREACRLGAPPPPPSASICWCWPALARRSRRAKCRCICCTCSRAFRTCTEWTRSSTRQWRRSMRAAMCCPIMCWRFIMRRIMSVRCAVYLSFEKRLFVSFLLNKKTKCLKGTRKEINVLYSIW